MKWYRDGNEVVLRKKAERLQLQVAEGGFLFGGHLGFGFGGFVGLASEVE